MADTRTQRGPHPKDRACFAPSQLGTLRRAVDDLSWLLSRGYSSAPAQRLVSDRYRLRDRQRKAIQRCAVADADRQRRLRHQVPPEAVAGEPLLIDGFNLLLTVEAALSGGLLLGARDGTVRDLTSMRRSYRKVDTTVPALQAIGEVLADLGSGAVTWYLDRPIANSDRLRRVIEKVAEEEKRSWSVTPVPNPDPLLRDAGEIVVTADSAILDRCRRWLNLARLVVETRVPGAWLTEL